jgi:hypothetical protein
MISTSVLELRPRNNLPASKQLLSNTYPAQKSEKPNPKKKKVEGNFFLEIYLQFFCDSGFEESDRRRRRRRILGRW